MGESTNKSFCQLGLVKTERGIASEVVKQISKVAGIKIETEIEAFFDGNLRMFLHYQFNKKNLFLVKIISEKNKIEKALKLICNHINMML